MSRKPDLWMPLYIADYLADTTHLNTERHGAYMLLLMASWKRGGSLPDDDAQLAAIARLDAAGWRKHSAILRAFFTADAGQLVQKRLAEVYADAVRVHDAQKANGAKGGRPKKQGKEKPTGFDSLNPRGKPEETPPPSPIQKQEQEPKTAPKGDLLDGISPEVAADFKALRSRLRSPITATALKGIQREANLAGLTLEAALVVCCERGWRGFNAEWLTRDTRAGPNGQPQPSRQAQGVAAILGVNANDLIAEFTRGTLVQGADRNVTCDLVPVEPRRLPGG